MKAGRIVAIVVGVLLALPSIALILGGGALTVGYAIEREDDGYFDASLERVSTGTSAVTTGDVDLRADPGPPAWLLDLVDFSVRLRARSVGEGPGLFLGIGPESDVEAYLAGVARDEIRDIEGDGDVRYRLIPGTATPAPPTEQTFWVASAAGSGAIEVEWEFSEGRWVAVLMNADGSPGVVADVTAGIRSGALLPVALFLLITGVVLAAIAVTIIVLAVRARPEEAPPAVEEEEAAAAAPVTASPVRLEATVDAPLSHWLWLVKWFLAIPHFIVLVFLWIAFVVLTIVAGFAILFTGKYPRGIFEFNVGVLRWSWRVVFYAGTGGLGTDKYPPFTTDAVDYPATLEIAYPDRLSQGLVLVKWWLLAIPHYLVVALLAGGGIGWWWTDDWGYGGKVWSAGLIGLLVFFAAVALLFTGRYPRPLFDLIIGLNRWVLRVAAYASLMTDQYPPFRLDQGGAEPETDREEGPAR